MPISDLINRFRSRTGAYTPVVHLLEDASSGLPSNQLATSQAAHVADQTLHAGEPGSGESLDAVGYWNKTYINATGATVVFSGPCVYGGYKVNAAAGAHTMTVFDNTAASGPELENAVSVNAAADTRQPHGIACDTGITVNLSGDPTDNRILVFYKPL